MNTLPLIDVEELTLDEEIILEEMQEQEMQSLYHDGWLTSDMCLWPQDMLDDFLREEW